jgi:excisionase family DNA binding protein
MEREQIVNVRKLRFGEAARRAGISTPTLRRLIASGDGPPLFRIGRRWFLVDETELTAWIASKKITPEVNHAV